MPDFSEELYDQTHIKAMPQGATGNSRKTPAGAGDRARKRSGSAPMADQPHAEQKSGDGDYYESFERSPEVEGYSEGKRRMQDRLKETYPHTGVPRLNGAALEEDDLYAEEQGYDPLDYEGMSDDQVYRNYGFVHGAGNVADHATHPAAESTEPEGYSQPETDEGGNYYDQKAVHPETGTSDNPNYDPHRIDPEDPNSYRTPPQYTEEGDISYANYTGGSQRHREWRPLHTERDPETGRGTTIATSRSTGSLSDMPTDTLSDPEGVPYKSIPADYNWVQEEAMESDHEGQSMSPRQQLSKGVSDFFKRLSGERAFGEPHRQEALHWHTKIKEMMGDTGGDAGDGGSMSGEGMMDYPDDYGMKAVDESGNYVHDDTPYKPIAENHRPEFYEGYRESGRTTGKYEAQNRLKNPEFEAGQENYPQDAPQEMPSGDENEGIHPDQAEENYQEYTAGLDESYNAANDHAMGFGDYYDQDTPSEHRARQTRAHNNAISRGEIDRYGNPRKGMKSGPAKKPQDIHHSADMMADEDADMAAEQLHREDRLTDADLLRDPYVAMLHGADYANRPHPNLPPRQQKSQEPQYDMSREEAQAESNRRVNSSGQNATASLSPTVAREMTENAYQRVQTDPRDLVARRTKAADDPLDEDAFEGAVDEGSDEQQAWDRDMGQRHRHMGQGRADAVAANNPRPRNSPRQQKSLGEVLHEQQRQMESMQKSLEVIASVIGNV